MGVPPAVASAVMRKVSLWVTECGPEWAVEHLKDIRRAYLRFLSGEKPEPSHWLSFHSDGTVRGPFRWFFSRNPKKMRTSLNCLLVYTWFRSNRPTPKAIKKFLNAVNKEPPSTGALVTADEVVSLGAATIRPRESAWKLFHTECPRLLTYSPTGKKMPGGMGEEYILRSLDPEYLGVFKKFVGLSSPGDRPSWTESFYLPGQTVLEGLVGPGLYDVPRRDGPIGEISFLNECGLKLRAVANPNRLFQLALRPLSDALFDVLKHIPEDATFDHQSGRERVREALKSGLLVHSMDLSNASDCLPLDLQMHILWDWGFVQSGNYDALVGLFHGLWRLPADSNVGDVELRWKTGQPLGLRPSFPMFSLLLHCIVRGHACRLGLYEKRTKRNSTRTRLPYVQIGDDLAIWNDDLYEAVVATLSSLGVEVSLTKGLCSRRAAEFAGMLITPEKVWPTLKFKPLTKASVLDTLSLFGPKGLALVPKSLRGRAAAVCCQPWPVGGGWNPKGLPLKERLPYYVTREEIPVQARVSRLVQATRNFYIAGVPAPSFGISTKTAWFSDQEIRDLIQVYIPVLQGLDPQLGIANLIGLASEKVPRSELGEQISLQWLMGITSRRSSVVTISEWFRSYIANARKCMLLAWKEGLPSDPTKIPRGVVRPSSWIASYQRR
jgi:hypothetical protein